MTPELLKGTLDGGLSGGAEEFRRKWVGVSFLLLTDYPHVKHRKCRRAAAASWVLENLAPNRKTSRNVWEGVVEAVEMLSIDDFDGQIAGDAGEFIGA